MADEQVAQDQQPAQQTSDPKWAITQAWAAKQAAKSAPEPKPEAKAEPKPEPKPEAKEPEPPREDPTRALARKLTGAPEPKAEKAAPSAWAETATQALKRAGMRDEEIDEMRALAAEKPWLGGWLDKLQKVQAKQDADFAALKAGTREPTPGARSQPAQQQGDQPGSGQVADLLGRLTKQFGEELGDDNATLLRDVLSAQEQRIADLQSRLEGHTSALQQERAAAEIEVMAQQARQALRGDFPWITDDAKFDAVAAEMAALRPSELTPDGVRAAMLKAARIVGYDELREDAKAVASKLDATRKDRLAATGPNGSSASEGPVLGEMEISMEVMRRLANGDPKDAVARWTQQAHERRRKANQR